MARFKNTKNTINNYIGSVSDDINSIETRIGDFFGDNFSNIGDNISNLFDERISQGLSDLISGATGVRTSNIPAIKGQVLKTRDANRLARQAALSSLAKQASGSIVSDRKVIRYPETMKGTAYRKPGDRTENFPNYIHFKTIERKHSNVGVENPDEHSQMYDIFLHLPDNIQDNLQVNYKEAETGIIDQIIAGLFFSGKSDVGEYQMNTDELKQSFFGMLPGSDLIKQGQGQVTNPLKFQIFEGVSFRTYNYSFTLRPQNAQEAQDIREMIHVFKMSALPGTQGANRRIYTFPNEWAIEYDGLVKNWLDFPLTSVLTGVEVDHTGGQGYVAHKDGSSGATTLSLAFTETVPLYRQRYKNEVSAYSESLGNRSSTAHLGTHIQGPSEQDEVPLEERTTPLNPGRAGSGTGGGVGVL